MSNKSRGLRPEYSPELVRSGVRGKYVKRLLEEGTNQVLIDPELHEFFPDAESVNSALRELVEIRKRSAS